MSRQPRPIPLTIAFRSGLWRLRSADDRLAGVFTDLRSALRWAAEETESHPGYALPALPSITDRRRIEGR